MTALIEATHLGDIQAVQMLLDEGADVNQVAEEGSTALIIAALFNNLSIARILLHHGADASIENDLGQTAFSLFSEHGVNLDNVCDLSRIASIRST